MSNFKKVKPCICEVDLESDDYIGDYSLCNNCHLLEERSAIQIKKELEDLIVKSLTI